MPETTKETVDIAAPAATVLAIIADVAQYPTWAHQFTNAVVEARDERARTSRAQLTLNAGMLKDTLVLGYSYTDTGEGGTVEWLLEKAQVIKALTGRYIVVSKGPDSCAVTFELSVDPGLPLLAMLRKKAEKQVVQVALGNLKTHAEQLATR